LDSATNITAENQIERLNLFGTVQAVEQIFQRHMGGGVAAEQVAALLFCTLLGYFTSQRDVVEHIKTLSRTRRHIESEQVDGRAGAHLLVTHIGIEGVEHRLDTTVSITADDG